jgi:RNA polymerase sigma-70 factor (ECF subfamily)
LTKPSGSYAGVDFPALLKGDRGAWHEFVDLFGPVIHGTVRAQLLRAGFGDEDFAEVVQNVFLRLCNEDFRLLRTYDPTRASLGTWLRVVSGSSAIDFQRRQKRTLSLDEVAEKPFAEPAHEPVPLNIPENLLTARQRLVLTMSYDRDMEVADIAVALGITAQTVRSMRHKAIERLRAWANDDEISVGK